MIQCTELGLSEMNWVLNGTEWLRIKYTEVEYIGMTWSRILRIEWNKLDANELFIILKAYVGMK